MQNNTLADRKYKMINIIGIVLIIVGFAWPYLTGWGLHNVFFWFGLLAVIRSGKYIPKTVNWNKWARAGLLAYLLMVLISMLVSYLSVVSTVFCNSWGGFYISLITNKIAAPFSSLFNLVFPYKMIKSSGGIYIWKISIIRATIASFIDILVYLIAGIIIGRWHEVRKRKN